MSDVSYLANEKCWETGCFGDMCCCEVCIHQHECSGSECDDEEDEE